MDTIIAGFANKPERLGARCVSSLAEGKMIYTPTSEEDRIAAAVVDAGFQVHKALGPGLLESAYEECLAFELAERSLPSGDANHIQIGTARSGLRIDLVVQSLVIVEIKAIEQLQRIHQAQLMTYLRLSGCRLGFLMNFTVPVFKNGVRRVVV